MVCLESKMQIDDKLISYLEDLSFLALSGDEKTRLAQDIEKILNDFTRLSGLNTDGVEEFSHPFGNVNVFRNDEAHPSFDRELILSNAPARNDEMIIAPKTVD
jgi:aspartyl-tRNA(Asn)/glutamyl-tRNA(Gln) amidotransferase subunit C